MIAETQVTVRNAGLLLVQRGAQVASGILFAMLVPRLMGPATYGRYALVASLSMWFVLASALGLTQVIGRYVPSLVLRRDKDALRTFLGNLLAVRLVGGAVAAGAYLLVTALWLRDLDPLVLVTVAGAVFVRATARLLFAFFLGVNQTARWGMGQVLRGWVSLVFLLAGFYLGGLGGACVGLLLTEVAVLLVAVWWIRPQIALPRPRLNVHLLGPYLRFGLTFFASDLLLAAFRRSGEAMVWVVSGDYVQVGYFGLAYGVFLMAALLFPQLTLAFAPLLTLLLSQGRIDELEKWIERLLKGLAVGGVLAVYGVLFLAKDVVPMVFGSAYGPVATSLLPLAVTLLALGLSSVARLLALVFDLPGAALAAAGVRLVAFWAVGPPLVAWRRSVGACLAVLAASVVYSAYLVWRMKRTVRFPLRTWALAIALGGLFLPLAWLHWSLEMRVVLYLLFLVGYGGALLLLRVVAPGEAAAAWRTIRRKSWASNG